MKCDFCSQDRSEKIWFEKDAEGALIQPCFECQTKTDRVPLVAVMMASVLLAAVSKVPRRGKKLDPSWLSMTSDKVKGFFQQTVETVYPDVSKSTVKEIDKVLIKRLDEKPTNCARCSTQNICMFYQFDDGKWSSICKTCTLIQKKNDEVIEKVEQEKVDEWERIQAITFRPVERTKIDRYTIMCTRCEIRFDPNAVAIVGAICEYCVRPEEAVDFWYQHELWNKPAPVRKNSQ